eukprot:CAMPEP_0168792394 /NCGR_PEP_ID=MMETSP0725-20121227/14497_1 /TAXON_ID=265536 /ORGANISM="Amphiprora sp., Strain CCMP467" /LENGTH=284 /DNA_ID=CAMNT_0008843037 /DNA_START=129 /DNA_END=983 /DNA_ORIENTATION=+
MTTSPSSSFSTTSTISTAPAVRIRPSIVLLGDSITEYAFGVEGALLGWATLLAAAYTRRADVLNRGFSGYNTDMCVNLLLPNIFPKMTSTSSSIAGDTTALPPSNVLFVTIFFGANDAAVPGESQHVPVERYQDNLRTTIRHIRESLQRSQPNTVVPILLITPPPFDGPAWMKHQQIEEAGRDNDVTRQYGLAAKAVVDEFEQVFCVDIWSSMKGDSPQELGAYLSDGLHLNNLGNQHVFSEVMSVLRENCPHLCPMQDGDGRYGKDGGIPMEEQLWARLLEQK